MNPPPRGSRRLRSLGIALGIVFMGFGGWFAFFREESRYEKPAPSDVATVSLLDRAMAAMGGSDALAEVKSLESHSVSTTRGQEFEVRVRVKLPDCYRHDVATEGAIYSHGTDGKEHWSSLDDAIIPLTDSDRESFEEQMLLLRCGMLASLKNDPKVTTKELGLRDDREWLEVRFDLSGAPRFLLGFDTKTTLLKTMEWESRAGTTFGRQRARFEMDHYETTGKIRVAMQGTYSLGGQMIAVDVTRSVVVNPTLDDAIFRSPNVEATPSPSVHLRKFGPRTVLWMAAEDSKQDQLERRIREFAEDQKFTLTGLPFFEYESNKLVGVGVPVSPPESAIDPKAQPKIEVREEQPTDLLTTIVRKNDEEAVHAACALMERTISDRGLERSGPYRLVKWKDDLAQLQARVNP
ncbi:MAG TPA: hypothetical protein PKA37_03115 [Planctomycetota bacterium]|nr:hypothetical protein [Planctomycetota bacterium]